MTDNEAIRAAAEAIYAEELNQDISGDMTQPSWSDLGIGQEPYEELAEAAITAAEPMIRADQDQKWIAQLAELCDNDWLRRRDRCMDLPGASTRRTRNASSAWEQAAHLLRSVLIEHGYDYDDPNRHDSYLEWMRGGRDKGEEERRAQAGT